MSLPSANLAAVWTSVLVLFLCLLFANLRVAGGGAASKSAANEQVTVFSAAPGNNSYFAGNVSYNNTQLILVCPGDSERTALWRRPDGSILCSSRRCLVNTEEKRLTNADSGDYVCRSSVANGTEYHVIHVNVLAPPGLVSHDLMVCKGEYKDHCTGGVNTIFEVYNPKFSVNISFYGNGPFNVEWYLNGTKFDCVALNRICLGISKGQNFQMITFRSYDIEDALKIAGDYRAVVSNPYGSNETDFTLEYSCKPTESPRPVSKTKKVVLNLSEGSTLDISACRVVMPSENLMYACFTRFDNWTIDSLSFSDCVTCDINIECTHAHSNSSFNDFAVRRLISNDCPPIQTLNFVKDDISLDDSGTNIVCIYSLSSGVKAYQSLSLDVSPATNNHQTPLALGLGFSLLFVIVVVTTILCTVACKILPRRRNSRQVPYVTIEGDTEEETVTPLLCRAPAVDSVSQYGACSTCSVAHQDFHQELPPDHQIVKDV